MNIKNKILGKISSNKNIEKQTKQNASESFNYAGDIKVELVKDDKIKKEIQFHNNGTKLFFKYILQSILGYNVANKMPSYVHLFSPMTIPNGTEQVEDILNSGLENIVKYSACVANVPMSTKNLVSFNNEYYAQYKFLIPYAQISSQTVQVIAFYNSPAFNSSDGLMAYVVLPTNMEIESNSNVLITWSIKLSNRTVSDEEVVNNG